MTTRKQHYVWVHYLQPWLDEEAKLHWSRNGEVFHPTNPVNVMGERDFYRLQRVTSTDATFLERFIIGPIGSAELRQSHRRLVDAFRHIAEADELIQSSDRFSPEEKRVSQAFVIKTEDDLQSQIEEDAGPILNKLRQERTDFIDNYEAAQKFFRFIAHQYFRTKAKRDAVGEALSQILPGHDFAHLTSIVCHIGAENLGVSLFVDRNEFDIIFLGSRDGREFITGDQPIVNLLSTEDGREPTNLVLYYPLSPVLACLLSPKEYGLQGGEIPCTIVQVLNELIAWASKQFLAARSDTVLHQIPNKPSLKGPATQDIVDVLVIGRAGA